MMPPWQKLLEHNALLLPACPHAAGGPGGCPPVPPQLYAFVPQVQQRQDQGAQTRARSWPKPAHQHSYGCWAGLNLSEPQCPYLRNARKSSDSQGFGGLADLRAHKMLRQHWPVAGPCISLAQCPCLLLGRPRLAGHGRLAHLQVVPQAHGVSVHLQACSSAPFPV